MSVYEAKRMYSRMVPETVSHFVVPSFPPSNQINPTLLVHFDGPNGSQIFTDATGRHALVGSGCVLDTSQSVFGGASCNFSPSSQHVTGDGNPDLAFGLNDFTVDFRVSRSLFDGFDAILYATDLVINPGAFNMTWNADGTFDAHIGNTQVIAGTTTFLVTGVFHHVAVTRKGGYMRLFADGIQEGQTYFSTDNIQINAAGPSIGASVGNSLGITGHIDEVRAINGTAAWVTAFTPPTAPYMVS